jgi:hypothetical protein
MNAKTARGGVLALMIVGACSPASRTEKPPPITLAEDAKSVPAPLAATLFEEVVKKGTASAEEVEALRNERGFNPRRFFVAERVDLDGDGTPELLIKSSRNEVLCTTANCPVWVYRAEGAGYDRLLEDVAGTIDGMMAMESSNQGMKDIRVQQHASASQRDVIVYRYDGKVYRRFECATDTYGVTDRGVEKVKTVDRPCP